MLALCKYIFIVNFTTLLNIVWALCVWANMANMAFLSGQNSLWRTLPFLPEGPAARFNSCWLPLMGQRPSSWYNSFITQTNILGGSGISYGLRSKHFLLFINVKYLIILFAAEINSEKACKWELNTNERGRERRSRELVNEREVRSGNNRREEGREGNSTLFSNCGYTPKAEIN